MTLFSFIIRETQIKSWTEVRLLTYQLCTNPSEIALGRQWERGAHTLPACMPAKLLQLSPILCDPMNCSPPGSSVHGDSPGKNTGVGCCALLQGIFTTRDRIHVSCVSCIGRRLFTASPTWEAPHNAGWCTKWFSPMEGDLATSGKTTEAWPPLT